MDSIARAYAGKAGLSPSASGRPYVLDFYCAKSRLAVEIDGISHDMQNHPKRDLRRSAWLAMRGITVLRIAAGDFAREIDETADSIIRLAAERQAPSTALRAVPLPRVAGED
jgi:very-short-patch-repair endonuclease